MLTFMNTEYYSMLTDNISLYAKKKKITFSCFWFHIIIVILPDTTNDSFQLKHDVNNIIADVKIVVHSICLWYKIIYC